MQVISMKEEMSEQIVRNGAQYIPPPTRHDHHDHNLFAFLKGDVSGNGHGQGGL